MGNFVFVQYEGPDAGVVLASVMGGNTEREEPELREYVAKTKIGFQPNPAEEPEEDELDEDGEDDDG